MATRENISGIHNYCDRWCERCAFTSRCAVFEVESTLTADERDIHNEKFWKLVAGNFRKALELLQKRADELGIDLSGPEIVQKIDVADREAEISEKHPLGIMAEDYAGQVGRWVEKPDLIQSKSDQLLHAVRFGITTAEQAEGDALRLKDCIEIVQWYQFLIATKIHRALSGKKDDDLEDNPLQNDANGSAKVAGIAIEKSMQAWSILLAVLPDSEDEILPTLALLERIRKLMQSEFPDCEKFMRPGFDVA